MNISGITKFNTKTTYENMLHLSEEKLFLEWCRRVRENYFDTAEDLLNEKDPTKKERNGFASLILIFAGIETIGCALTGNYSKENAYERFSDAWRKLGLSDDYLSTIWSAYRCGLVHAGDTLGKTDELFEISYGSSSKFYQYTKDYSLNCFLLSCALKSERILKKFRFPMRKKRN